MEENEIVAKLLVKILQNKLVCIFEALTTATESVTYGTIKKYYFPDYEKEDFLQEAQIVLYEAAKSYDENQGMDFLQYYHMRLSNHLNMLVRKNVSHKRKVNLQSTSLDKLVEKAGIGIQGKSSSDTCPQEMAVVKETLNNYLIELSPFEKNVFWLFINGRTHEEIKKELQCKLNQVHNAIYRCKLKLKNIIN